MPECKCKPPIYIESLTDLPFIGICFDCKGYRKIPPKEMPK